MTPCPSPRGTNYERLFIVRKPFPPVMAMDAAIGEPDYPAALNDPNDDIVDKVRELIAGKLEPADLDALLKLIQGDPEPEPVQDRRRRGMAHDELRRHVSAGLARRARVEIAGLELRFPALKNARVVG